jgi:signal transduction histidine kinase
VGDRAVLAVENERLQRALRARLKEEQALRRVATLVASEHAPGDVLALVTEEVGRHLEADTAVTVRYDAPGLATFVATWTAPHVDPSPFRVGRQIEPVPRGALARALETVAPVRVDSYEGLPGRFAGEVRASGIRATVATPILVDGELWGAFAAGSNSEPFGPESEARLGAFAELVAQAIANVDARIKLKESRARIVAAADEARRRIERDLHDGAQQRLVALALSLQLVARSAESATAEALRRCIEDLHTALAELRELARGLHPAILTDRGVSVALQELAARSPVPVVLDADLDGRLPAAQEAALYFVAAEALTNVAKYAKASAVEVTLHGDDRWAEIVVSDDGVGGARAEEGGGLRGLGDRVEALGGRLTLASTPEHGTTVRARVPVDGALEASAH